MVDVPVAHHEGGGRRRERDGYESREGREGRSERGAHRRVASHERTHHHRAQPIDDFFLKPYEPSPGARNKVEDKPASAAPQKAQTKQPLAALLGGLGSSWRNKPTSSSSN